MKFSKGGHSLKSQEPGTLETAKASSAPACFVERIPIPTSGPEDFEVCWLEQPLNLVFRQINGRYFVTVPERRKVIVLNRAGFKVLELCHQRTLASVRSALAVGDPLVDTNDLEKFLRSLEAHGLLTVATAHLGSADATEANSR